MIKKLTSKKRGWYSESFRHSNARKFGKAGGKYHIIKRYIHHKLINPNKSLKTSFKIKNDEIEELKNNIKKINKALIIADKGEMNDLTMDLELNKDNLKIAKEQLKKLKKYGKTQKN